MNRRVVVIGAGVIGLPCAYRIQTEIPSIQVTVIAREFSPDLTSDISGGLWSPYASFGHDEKKLMDWAMETYFYILSLASSSDSVCSGTSTCDWHTYSQIPIKDPVYKDKVLNYRRMTSRELKKRPNCVDGYSFLAPICEPVIYLPWLTQKFLRAGGRLQKRKVESLQEIEGFDLIINCTGLGAGKLVKDENVAPIGGQVSKVRTPWLLKGSCEIDAESGAYKHYVIPGQKVATIGGTFQKGDWNTEVNEETKQEMFKEAIALEPTLKGAEIVYDAVGLRPSRTNGVRLEAETQLINGLPTKVIHNYGHGGIGVTLHWGCASQVLQLVRQELSIPVTSSKL